MGAYVSVSTVGDTARKQREGMGGMYMWTSDFVTNWSWTLNPTGLDIVRTITRLML